MLKNIASFWIIKSLKDFQDSFDITFYSKRWRVKNVKINNFDEEIHATRDKMDY